MSNTSLPKRYPFEAMLQPVFGGMDAFSKDGNLIYVNPTC